jgi:hypothetical protein
MIAIWRPTSLKSALCANADPLTSVTADKQTIFRNQEVIMKFEAKQRFGMAQKIGTGLRDVDFQNPRMVQSRDFLLSSQRRK